VESGVGQFPRGIFRKIIAMSAAIRQICYDPAIPPKMLAVRRRAHMLEQQLCYSSADDLAHSLLYLQNLPKKCMVDLIIVGDASKQVEKSEVKDSQHGMEQESEEFKIESPEASCAALESCLGHHAS